MPKFLKDAKHNGIELYFDGKPSEKYIITLKEHGWRWNPAKKCWYTSDTEDNVRFAKKLCDVKKTSKALTATAKPLKDQKTQKTQTENAKECLEKKQSEAKTSENSTSEEYEKVTENGEKTKEIIELQLIPIEKVEKEPKQRKAKNNKDNEIQQEKPVEEKAETTAKSEPAKSESSAKMQATAESKAKKQPIATVVSENVVEFAQNTPAGVTKIKITKVGDRGYKISSTNKLIICADCKHHVSINTPRCLFCGASLAHSLEIYFNLQHKKKKAENEKQTVKDLESLKKENVNLFEERHELFFNREHRKYLMDLKEDDFKTVMARSEYIFNNREKLPYLSSDVWMRLMRLENGDFEREIKLLFK